MKVLYLVYDSHPYGSNRALLNIIDGMANNNIDSMLVTSHYGTLCDELKKRGINYKIVNSRFKIYPSIDSLKGVLLFIPRILKMLFVNFNAEKKLECVINEFQPDLIHTNIGPLDIGYNVAKKLGIPHLWHIREYQDLDFGMRPFPSKYSFMSKINSLENNSVAITKGIFNHFHMNNNARLIYDGVLNKKNIQFVENKSNYFLFLGRLDEGKGIKQLLIAFIDFAVNNDSYKLLIAGNGKDIFVNKLIDIVNKSGFANRIHFLGFRDDVTELLSNATALIVPSLYEGFGFITVEAMYNGCLVIGNNSGGTKEILESENLGILYCSHDELVSTLKKIVAIGIESYYPIIKKSQIMATKLYSKERNAKNIYKFYQDILYKRQN